MFLKFAILFYENRASASAAELFRRSAAFRAPIADESFPLCIPTTLARSSSPGGAWKKVLCNAVMPAF